LNSLDKVSKNTHTSDVIKIIRWEPNCSVQKDRQTWRSWSFFMGVGGNFANAPKNREWWWQQYSLSVKRRIIY